MLEEVKFVRPTHELIEAIALDMRLADCEEIWASSHHTPIQSLMEGWEISDYSVIATVNDEPCVMFGLVIRDILNGTGVPWMLGTDYSIKYKRHFSTQTPLVIEEMLNICPKLFNFVHAKNKVSVRWLKRLGFILDEPLPYGCDNELFHKFNLERV